MKQFNKALLENYLKEKGADIEARLDDYRQMLKRKIIVLDDDPTGIQAVHGIMVYTDWSLKTLEEAFENKQNMFFVLTNSRSFSVAKTKVIHREIAENISRIAEKTQQKFIIVSRSDSTLRGHYPTETQILKDVMEMSSGMKFDGEIICPFFSEAGRITIENVHYVLNEGRLIPVNQTEFAKDLSFGYSHAHLGDYIEEKTKGTYKSKACVSIALSDIRARALDKIVAQLMEVKAFNKVIINAVNYDDLQIVVLALYEAIAQGKNFMIRSAASLPKVLAGIMDQPLLLKESLVCKDNSNGGLVLIGSHVNKTTLQLEALRKSMTQIRYEELVVTQMYEEGGLEAEVTRLIKVIDTSIAKGITVVIYTSRVVVNVTRDKDETVLDLSINISEALTNIVRRITHEPRFILAKGGITSSDIGTKGLGVKKALVLGQVQAGIPVWQTDQSSRFPTMPYIIFPGNVGREETLKEIIELLL